MGAHPSPRTSFPRRREPSALGTSAPLSTGPMTGQHSYVAIGDGQLISCRTTSVGPARSGDLDPCPRGGEVCDVPTRSDRPVEPNAPCPTRASARGLGRRGERGADAWLVQGNAGVRAPPLQVGSPGTADGEAISVPIVLSRGRPRYGRRHLAAPGSHHGKRVDSAPSLSQGGHHYRRWRDRGDRIGLG